VTDKCVVCGHVCGTLKGASKSWPCAGRLAHAQRLAGVSRAKYAKKNFAREVVARYFDDVVDGPGGQGWVRPDNPYILDLWGGGSSVDVWKKLYPTATILAAERDKSLWPALRQAADAGGYRAWCGSVESLVGQRGDFDMIYLDLCCQASRAAENAIAAASVMLGQRHRTALAVTVMPARENDPFLARSRCLSLPLWCSWIAERPLAAAVRYRASKQEMWLVLLGGREFEPEKYPTHNTQVVRFADSLACRGWAVARDVYDRSGSPDLESWLKQRMGNDWDWLATPKGAAYKARLAA
jgi:hypothetical protein